MFQDKAGVLIGHDMLLINSSGTVESSVITFMFFVIYHKSIKHVFFLRDCVLSFGHSYSEIVFATRLFAYSCVGMHFWRAGCLTEVGFSPNLTTTSRNAKREKARSMKHREDTLETRYLKAQNRQQKVLIEV